MMLYYYQLIYITLIINTFSPMCIFSILIYYFMEVLFKFYCISIYVYFFPFDLKKKFSKF